MAKDYFVITRDIVYPMNDMVNDSYCTPFIIPVESNIDIIALGLMRNINKGLSYDCSLGIDCYTPQRKTWDTLLIMHGVFTEATKENYVSSDKNTNIYPFPALTMFRAFISVDIEDDTDIDPNIWLIISISFRNEVDINDPDGVFI